jgi:hypothetical protein
MPTIPSSLNVYLKNLTDASGEVTALTFSISVDGHRYCTAVHPQAVKRALAVASHETQSVGVALVELEFHDLRGHLIQQGEVLRVLMRSKWSISASVVDGASVVQSNSLAFPLSREQCEGGIACSL